MAGPDASQQVIEALLDDLMWTPTTRAQHSRAGLRYGSDLTDAEWAVLEPLLPPRCRHGVPLRRFGHAAHPQARPFHMSSATDTKAHSEPPARTAVPFLARARVQ